MFKIQQSKNRYRNFFKTTICYKLKYLYQCAVNKISNIMINLKIVYLQIKNIAIST